MSTIGIWVSGKGLCLLGMPKKKKKEKEKEKKESLYYQSDFKLRVKWVLTHYIVFFFKKNRGP
jgi:hypothetical protein